MKEGTVIIARIVPFLNGCFVTTEVVVSFSGDAVREQLQKSYGVTPVSLSSLSYRSTTKIENGEWAN